MPEFQQMWPEMETTFQRGLLEEHQFGPTYGLYGCKLHDCLNCGETRAASDYNGDCPCAPTHEQTP